MRSKILRARTVVPALLLVTAAAAGYALTQDADHGDQGGQQPAPETAPPPLAPDAVAVDVNGVSILEGDVRTRAMAILQERFRGAAPAGADMEQLVQMLRPQILDAMIDEELLDQDADRADLAVSDEAYLQDIQQRIAAYLVQTGLSQAEFEQQIREFEDASFEEFCQRRSQDEEFRRIVRHEQLVRQRYPEQVAITPEEVTARYERDKEAVYTQEAKVRASHILVLTESATTDEAKAAARAKAEDLRAKAVAEGADFAALAREHSECPSAPQGGDLDFFPREGAMVEPFAAAAFALPVGGTSEVVETQFGYHVIRVTDRKEARVVSLEEATPIVRAELVGEKTAAAREELVAALRTSAEIVYPTPGSAPGKG